MLHNVKNAISLEKVFPDAHFSDVLVVGTSLNKRMGWGEVEGVAPPRSHVHSMFCLITQ